MAGGGAVPRRRAEAETLAGPGEVESGLEPLWGARVPLMLAE